MHRGVRPEVLRNQRAKVAELADAPDLGSGGETLGGSSPPFRTNPSCCPRDYSFFVSSNWGAVLAVSKIARIISSGIPVRLESLGRGRSAWERMKASFSSAV